MKFLFTVGHVTTTATREIAQIGGSVVCVSHAPLLHLVSIPYPRLEYMEITSHLRIRKSTISLVWRGNDLGPGLTAVDETTLFSEWNEPQQEAQTLPDDDLGDSNDCLF
jgi:hypothetical protein